MKVLMFGAGVLGSLYAARLQESGADVTLAARGKRYQDLKQHGVVLENFLTGKQTVTQVRVVEGMPEEEHFDLCVMLVQYNQLKDAAEAVSKNKNISTVLVMANYLKGLDEIERILGYGRMMLGHVNAGGERDGHVVKYMTAEYMTMGELNGRKSRRLLQAVELFKQAGFPVKTCSNMDAWKRHHLALLTPMSNALYLNDINNYKLAKNKEDIKRSVIGARETMKALQAKGFPIYPKKLMMMNLLPLPVLTALFSKVLATKVMDIGGARHVRNAREEVLMFSRELIEVCDETGTKAPVFRQLHQQAHTS